MIRIPIATNSAELESVVRRIDGAALIANGNIIDLSGFGESQ